MWDSGTVGRLRRHIYEHSLLTADWTGRAVRPCCRKEEYSVVRKLPGGSSSGSRVDPMSTGRFNNETSNRKLVNFQQLKFIIHFRQTTSRHAQGLTG